MVEFHPCRAAALNLTAHELLGYWRTLREIDALGFKLWKVWNNSGSRRESMRLKGVKYYRCFNAYYINIKYLQ